MSEIKVGENESLDSALRRFKRKCAIEILEKENSNSLNIWKKVK